jgi:hypothetical protein
MWDTTKWYANEHAKDLAAELEKRNRVMAMLKSKGPIQFDTVRVGYARQVAQA